MTEKKLESCLVNKRGFMKNNKKAFSVAEATIALLIGSIALGMAAPMITKQIKQNNFNDTQFSLLNQQNNNLLERINELEDIIRNLSDNDSTPAGAVMFFDLSKCPSGWTELSSKYSKASGAFIRNLGESGRAVGSYQAGAVPDIELALRVDYNGGSLTTNKLSEYGNDDNNRGALFPTGGADEPMFNISKQSKTNRAGDLIKSDVYNKDVQEVRPNNIALLACRKNND